MFLSSEFAKKQLWQTDEIVILIPKKVEGRCKISKKLKRGALVFRRGEIGAENGKNLGGFTDIVCELRPKAPECQISVEKGAQ